MVSRLLLFNFSHPKRKWVLFRKRKDATTELEYKIGEMVLPVQHEVSSYNEVQDML